MPAISGNLTLTLDGSTALRIGSETVRWNGSRAMDGVFVWSADATPLREVTITLTASDWFASTITTGGATRVTLTDAASGADRQISTVQLYGAGDHVVNLSRTEVDYLATGDGDDNVTVGGSWVAQINTHGGNDTVTSGSTWVETLHVGSGDNSVTIGSGGARAVLAGEGADRITLLGEVDHVTAGRGADLITTGENWAGTIEAGRGIDRVVLGAGGATLVNLGRDADTLVLAQQDDADSILILQGGGNVSTPQDSDTDTLKLSAFTVGLTYDLGQTEAVRSAQGSFFALGFENVIGGRGADRLSGNDEDNRIAGGSGRDTLQGDMGADTLAGGRGADRFVFTDLEESDVEAPDLITDFRRAQGDRIDLQGLDANAGLDDDQAFTFIGSAAFSGEAGELRAQVQGNRTLITGDLDGDGTADFGLLLNGTATLSAG
ncbi:MAG: calcium-binding protein, partial [Gemmobacter sp.]|uniref:calcium-binding protein n=1 Tax=Gemmobacter sp. TaxID=1898957 RepID=UPI001A587935